MGFLNFLNTAKQDTGKVFNFLGQTATDIYHQGKNAVDIANAGRQLAQGTAQAAAAAVTHNPVAEQNAINKTIAASNYSLNASRGALTPADVRGDQGFNIIKPIARNVATYAPYAVPVGKIAEGASLPIRFLAKGGANAAVSGGSTALSEAVNGKGVNPGDVAKSAALGFGLGVAGEAAPIAARAAGKAGAKAGEVATEAGLPAAYRLGPEDKLVLSNLSDRLSGADKYDANLKPSEIVQQDTAARAIGKKIGLDVISGSPRDRSLRIGNFLENYDANKQALRQHGAIGTNETPGLNGPESNHPTIAPQPVRPAPALTPDTVKALQKAQTPEEAQAALKDAVLPQGAAERIAPAAAITKDSNVINSLAEKQTAPPPSLATPPSAADITAPTRPFDAQQTAFENAWNKGDIQTAQQVVDSLPDKGMQQPLQKLIDTRKAELAKNPPAPAAPEQQGTPAQRVISALQGQSAGKGQPAVAGTDALLQKQSALYGAERAARLAKAQGAGANLTGREAVKAQLGQLKGELPKVDAQTLIDHLNQNVSKEDVNGLLDTLRTTPNLQGYENITAQNALVNLFDKGELPNQSEWDVLQKGLGEDFTTAVKTTALDSMTRWQQVKNYAVQILGAPKAVMASLDLSGGGRQGAVLGSRFMPEWLDAQKRSAIYFVNDAKFKADMQEIAASPDKALYDRMGIHLSGTGGTEEQFPTSLAEHLPGDNPLSKIYNKTGGAAIQASDRAYTGGLTQLRAQAASHIISDLKGTGIDPNALPDKTLKSIGQFIDTASGRGSLGALEKHATSLSEALFSPRLWKSRLDMLNPVYYAKLNPIARKYALQSAASFASIAGIVLTLAAAAGAKVETDARSSDFLKIKIGDTRYDILGGFQQNLVLADRLITGQKKSSITGHLTDLTQGTFGQATRLSVLTDFIQNKENPVFSTAQTILAGHDKAGNPVNPATEIGKLFLPLGIGDTYNAIKNTGNIPEGILKATIPGTFGIGVGTYGMKDIQLSGAQKQYVRKLTSQGAGKDQINAVTSFYQTAKTGPDRKAASDEIKKALQSGDQNKAVSLAEAYNKAYNVNIQSWGAKNKQYANDPQLLKDYQSGLFTDESLYRMIDTITKAKGG